MSKGFSRRSFVTSAAALGGMSAIASLPGVGAAALAAENKPQAGHVVGKWRTPPPPITDKMLWKQEDCDIVIVGAGMAGLPATVYAAERGAKVVCLEKGGRYGQHRLCTGGFNSEVQKRDGLTFDREEVIKSAWRISNGCQSMIKHYGTWFDNSPEYINWLEKVFNSKGWGLASQAAIAGDAIVESLKNTWWPGFPALILFIDKQGGKLTTGANPDWTGLLYQVAQEKGAKVCINTPAVQLVRDRATGRVTSVIAKDEIGRYIRYNARKGVLLATGDLGGDKELMLELNPSLARCSLSICEAKNTGDGHKMGVWVGAGIDDFVAGDMFPFVSPWPPVEINRAGIRSLDNPLFKATQYIGWRPSVASLPVFMVDSVGRRLAAEDLPFQAYAVVSLNSPNGLVWSVWDSDWEKKFPENFPRFDVMTLNTQEQLDLEVAKGHILKFNSIDELIKGTGVDPATFKENLDRYHALCKKGHDDDCYKNPKWMTAIDTPPFYAAKHGAGLDSTRGGLKMEDNQIVLDTKGLPIPGLYAAGNVAGSFYGSIYPPNIMGSGIGHAQTFGWLAIRHMLRG